MSRGLHFFFEKGFLTVLTKDWSYRVEFKSLLEEKCETTGILGFRLFADIWLES